MRFTTHPLADAKVAASLTGVRSDLPMARRLAASLAVMTSAGDDLARKFYDRLFAGRPELRPMFPADMANQRAKLLHTLEWVVGHLDQPEQVLPALTALGRKHADFGTLPAHYPIVTDTLVQAMADTAGMAWDRELEADWRTAIRLLSERMIAGASGDK